MFERPRSGERTILVHVDFPGAADPEDLLEFTDLARSAGARPVATITASRSAPEENVLALREAVEHSAKAD